MKKINKLFSVIYEDKVLCFSVLIIFFATIASIKFTDILPPIEEHIHSDKPVYILTFATMFAASLTLWVSWLIKKEAKEISKNIVNTNNYLVRMENLKCDYSLLLDVTAITLEKMSKSPGEKIYPISEWSNMLDAKFITPSGINKKISKPDLKKLCGDPEFQDFEKKIRTSIFWFIVCFRQVSNNFENLGLVKSVLEIMPEEKSELLNDLNKKFIKNIDELILCEKDISDILDGNSTGVQAWFDKGVGIARNIDVLIKCVTELLARLASKSSHSADLMFMLNAYKLYVVPVEDDLSQEIPDVDDSDLIRLLLANRWR